MGRARVRAASHIPPLMRVLLAAEPPSRRSTADHSSEHPRDVEVGPQAGLGAVHALPRDELVSLAAEALELRIGALERSVSWKMRSHSCARGRWAGGVGSTDLGVGVLDHVRREEDNLRHLRRRHRRGEPRPRGEAASDVAATRSTRRGTSRLSRWLALSTSRRRRAEPRVLGAGSLHEGDPARGVDARRWRRRRAQRRRRRRRRRRARAAAAAAGWSARRGTTRRAASRATCGATTTSTGAAAAAARSLARSAAARSRLQPRALLEVAAVAR